MRPRRLFVIAAAAASLLALAVPTTLAGPAQSATALGEVRIQGPAHEGARGQILLDLKVSCRPGLTAYSVSLVFSQGDVTGPEELANPPVCDGALHRVRHSSVEGFDAGAAHVDVVMTLVDSASGVPRATITRSKDIFVRPAAKVVLPSSAYLTSSGGIRATVWARCDEPWTPGDFYVSASQGTGVSADTLVDGVVCDGDLHAFRVLLQPDSGRFRAGWVQLSGELTVFDEFFDPVAQGRASRAVRVS